MSIKMIKKSERFINTALVLKSVRDMGMKSSRIGKYCKWKEIESGKIQVTLEIIEVETVEGKRYFYSDSLGRVASEIGEGKREHIEFLMEHGFKPEKQWYLEDCGMTEETWSAWNGTEEEE